MRKSKTMIMIIACLLISCLSFLASYFFLKGIGVVAGSEITITVEISDSTHNYDGQAHYLETNAIRITNGKLADGHRIEASCSDFLVNAGSKNVVATINVYDEQGFDVTKRYNIRYNSPKIIVNPMPITFEITSDDQMIYNGNKLTYNKVNVIEGSLVVGHEFKPYIEAGVTNVWDSEDDVNVISHIYDQAGNDVTSNYSITVNVGSLRVYERKITIKPVDCTFTYDGKLKEATDYEIVSGSLVAGDTIKCEFGGAGITSGEHDSYISTYKIVNELNEDVTDNYLVTCQTGIIQIDKKALTVKAPDKVFKYDGKAHNSNDYKDEVVVTGLLTSHKLLDVEFTDDSSILDVGSKANKIKKVTITDSQGEDVTDCYDITTINGVLKVEGRKVVLEAISKSFEYNGTEYKISSSDGLKSSEGLIDGDVVEFEYTGSQTEAGKSVNSIKSIKIVREKNGFKSDVTSYYDIEVIDGVIEVTKAPLKIAYYDEANLQNVLEEVYIPNGQTFNNFGDIFVGCENATLKTKLEIVAVGYMINLSQYYTDEALRASEVIVYDKQRNNVTNNYEIDYSNYIVIYRVNPNLLVTIGGEFNDGDTVKLSDIITNITGLLPTDFLVDVLANEVVISSDIETLKSEISDYFTNSLSYNVTVLGTITVN